MAETRTQTEKVRLMHELADVAKQYGIQVILCNEDRALQGIMDRPTNLSAGVCAPPEDFAQEGLAKPPSEGCGCVLMVDPYTVNESCSYGCLYCYAADKSLSPKKRNTTHHLRVIS